MNKHTEHEHWMKQALDLARSAMASGELPIGAIVVADGRELSRSTTRTAAEESITAHGELFALLHARRQVFTAPRPLIVYTTLEPCVMCLGAAMQCEVDIMVFGMRADPDGGTRLAPDIAAQGLKAPELRGGVLEQEAVVLMREFLRLNPNHFGASYVEALLANY